MSDHSAKKFAEKWGYYLLLVLFALVGLAVIFHRSRLGVDLTDEAWYSSEPYWVAKGSTPYVNNWTQASGFTLPLFLAHKLFLFFNGTNEGIILFSRILYCVWKTVVSICSFILLKKAGIKIHPILITPVIVFTAFQLHDINYNTIGWSYMLFALVAMFNIFRIDLKKHQKFFWGIITGVVIGRSVIGTPASIAVCIVAIVVLIYEREWDGFKGVVLGGLLDFFAVVIFCSYRGGFKNFVIGLQYFIRDLAYNDDFSLVNRVPFAEGTAYLFRYIMPAIAYIVLAIILRVLLKKHKDLLNKILAVLASLMLLILFYKLLGYSGGNASIDSVGKYGWFIPLAFLFSWTEKELRNRFKYISYITVSYVLAFIIQGYTSNFGFSGRGFWNVIPLIFSVYSTLIYLYDVFRLSERKIKSQIGVVAVSLFLTVPICRGAYGYVYRDLPCEALDTKVESGIWKGCYTTAGRAATVVEIEDIIRQRTDDSDQFFCFGDWSCFINLLSNGQLCAPNAIGVGQKNGFDYWHMYQKVPNRIFVHVDVEDQQGRMTSKFNIWIFVSKYYQQTYEFDYESYDTYGEPALYRIYEFELTDYEGALSYADSMASEVFDFE